MLTHSDGLTFVHGFFAEFACEATDLAPHRRGRGASRTGGRRKPVRVPLVRPTGHTVDRGRVAGWRRAKIVSALASRLAVNNAPVRLKVVETTGPIESAAAF
jgi:hypothetical protein